MKMPNVKKVFTLIKHNYVINRTIPILLFVLIFVIGCSIASIAVSDVESMRSYYTTIREDYIFYTERMTETYDDLLGRSSVFEALFFFTSFVAAILSAASLTGFMRSKSGVDFYHSLAVNRTEMFLAHYITAFVNIAFSLIATQTVAIFMINFIATFKPMSLGQMFLAQIPVMASVLIFLALFLALAMIACVCAGNVFTALLNYVCINFYVPATILAVAVAGDYLFNSSLNEYLSHHPAAYAFTSPFLRYTFSSSGYYTIGTAGYVVAVLITLALIVFGIWLFSVRKNENSHRAFPFKQTVRPLQYMITFDATLLGATFFNAISSSVIWGFIGMLLAIFFSFIIFNAVADSSFTGVFKRSWHMAIMLGVVLIIGTVFVADLFGIYKEPMPDLDKIESANIHVTRQYTDREEGVSIYLEKDMDNEYNREYADPITDENRKLVKKLYVLVAAARRENEEDAYYYSYEKSREEDSISVSMNINCESDFSGYHKYCYISETSPYWDEINEIVNKLIESSSKADVSVYEYETQEVYA